jgi:hypothetical protein
MLSLGGPTFEKKVLFICDWAQSESFVFGCLFSIRNFLFHMAAVVYAALFKLLGSLAGRVS